MTIKPFHLFESSNSDESMLQIRDLLSKMNMKFRLRYRNRGQRKPEDDEFELVVPIKENGLEHPNNWLDCLRFNFIKKIESSTNYQYDNFWFFGSAPNDMYIELKNRKRKSSKYDPSDIYGRRSDYGEFVYLDEYFKMLNPSPPDVIHFMDDISLEWVDLGFSFGAVYEIKPYLTNDSGQIYYHSENSGRFDWTKESKYRPKIYLNHGGENLYVLRFSSDKNWAKEDDRSNIRKSFVEPFLERLKSEYDIKKIINQKDSFRNEIYLSVILD